MSFSIRCGASAVVDTSFTGNVITFSPIPYPPNWNTMTPAAQMEWLEKTAEESLYLTNEGTSFFEESRQSMLDDVARRATCETCPGAHEPCKYNAEFVDPRGGLIATPRVSNIVITQHSIVVSPDGITGISIAFTVTFTASIKVSCSPCGGN